MRKRLSILLAIFVLLYKYFSKRNLKIKRHLLRLENDKGLLAKLLADLEIEANFACKVAYLQFRH
jgi:hypothetical protein